MQHYIISLWKEEKGATALEYGLIAALIAGVIATAIGSLGTQVSGIFESISNAITTAMSGA